MESKNTPIARPFLKWAGGKGQLISQIKEHLPAGFVASGKIPKYFEPFVGGGAVFFWLSNQYTIRKAYLYDINPDIINAYRVVRDSLRPLLSQLKKLETDYRDLPVSQREAFYYNNREEANSYVARKHSGPKVRRAALMIFLNKTCFNGLFRVNSQGLFNVPFGRYAKPTICDETNLWAVHLCLQNAEIECVDFAHCLKKADKNSLVYFDPPYRPISRTASFTGYIKNGFNDADQRRLKNTCDRLTRQGARVILSNSDPKNTDPNDNFFDELYTGSYRIERLKAARMINCNAGQRGLIKEILVTNYA